MPSYEAGYRDNRPREGERPEIYLTLHSFAFNRSIVDLSSSKEPEGAVCFGKNSVRSIFLRCQGEKRTLSFAHLAQIHFFVFGPRTI